MTKLFWPATEMASWEAFLQHCAEVLRPGAYPPSHLFRSQANASWPLTPTLVRRLRHPITPKRALEIEAAALVEFQAQAHLYYPPAAPRGSADEADLIAWWPLMQHHGAPTRLLDWTASPYVAAYFACEKEEDNDGAVYVVAREVLSSEYHSVFGETPMPAPHVLQDPAAPDVLLFFTPTRKTDRLAAQQGYFSISTHVLGDHDGTILRVCSRVAAGDASARVFRKWIIPARLKATFLRQLRVMNVIAQALFPGLDGLARSINELVWLEARRGT